MVAAAILCLTGVVAGTARLVFDSPELVGACMGPANFIGLDEAEPGSRVVFGSCDGTVTLATQPGAARSWTTATPTVSVSETFPSHCESPCTAVHTFGNFVPYVGVALALDNEAALVRYGGGCRVLRTVSPGVPIITPPLVSTSIS
jgi:hypothetical protein